MLAHPEIASAGRVASSFNNQLLLAILSIVAGLVDVTGFLSFKHVFTAHVTGNLVVMAVQLAEGGSPHVAQLLSIPVFVLTVAVAYLMAQRGRATAGRGSLLVAQSLCLVLVLGLAVRTPGVAPSSMEALAETMLAVAAMGFQNAFVRVSLHESSTTSVMTGNLASATIALLAVFWPGAWTRDQALKKLRGTLPLLTGFFIGCVLGAAILAPLGPWSWSLPVLLSLIAIPIGAAVVPVAQPLPIPSGTPDRQA